jgi:hypothetical protein
MLRRAASGAPHAAPPNNINGRRPSHVYFLTTVGIVDSLNRDLGPTHRFLALTGGTNLDRANDHSAHEACALSSPPNAFPSARSGRDRRHMKAHKNLRFTEARSNVVEAVASASRYKRYKIGGKRHRNDREGTYGALASLSVRGKHHVHQLRGPALDYY